MNDFDENTQHYRSIIEKPYKEDICLKDKDEMLFDEYEDSNSLLAPNYNSKKSKTSQRRDKPYHIYFLAIFIVTHILPVIISCKSNQSLECYRETHGNSDPGYSFIYQLGNMAGAVLTILMFHQLFNILSLYLEVIRPEGIPWWHRANYAIWLVSLVTWLVYVCVSTVENQNTVNAITEEITLNMYFISAVLSNFLVHSAFKFIMNTSPPGQPMRAFKLIKTQTIFLITMLIIIGLYFILKMLYAVLILISSDSDLTTISNYIDLSVMLGILVSQFYIILYNIDINYIYQSALSYRKREEFKDGEGYSLTL